MDTKEQIWIDTVNKLRNQLSSQGASSAQIESTVMQLKDKIDNEALPRIAMIGFTGVGKSTTLNALFNAGQPTGDIRACTQKEAQIIGDVSKYTGSKGSVIIYDMPGLGEDLKADQRHFETYKKVLPLVDLAVWTFHTGDRSMTPMQEALLALFRYIGKDFSSKLMFAINKADAIAPGESDWNQQLNIPSQVQRKNINELEKYIMEKVHQIIPYWKGPIVSYSAKKFFRLEQLMTAMIETLDSSRRWVLDSVADVADTTKLINPQYYEYINSLRSK